MVHTPERSLIAALRFPSRGGLLRRSGFRLAALLLLSFLLAAPALAQRDALPELWAVDGDVRGMAVVGDTLFVTGLFSTVGPPTGMLAALDRTTGEPELALDRIDASELDILGVTALAPDGRGGLFAGGSFNRAGGAIRHHLVRYRADGTIDESFRPDPVRPSPLTTPDGNVSALLFAPDIASPSGEGVLFVGGAFTEIRDDTGVHERDRLAALDAGTGAVLPLSFVFEGPPNGTVVRALALDAGVLYAGGTFTGVGAPGEPAEARPGAAAFAVSADAATAVVDGALLAWNPALVNADGQRPRTEALLASGTGTLYVAGNFASVHGEPRSRLAEVTRADPATGEGGEPTAWAPSYGGSGVAYFSLVLAGDELWAAGGFVQQGQRGLARIDRQTGQVVAFAVAPGIRSGRALVHDPASPLGDGGPSGQGVLYLGAVQDPTDTGAPYPVVVGVDPATGLATDFRVLGGRDNNRQPRALLVMPETGSGEDRLGGRLVVGGPYYFLGARDANGLAALDLTTGRALDRSLAGQRGALHASPDGRFLYHYERLFGIYLDEYDLATGAVRDFTDPDPLDPPPDAPWPPAPWQQTGVFVANARSALAVSGDTLFASMGGAAALDRTDAALLWRTVMPTVGTLHNDQGTVLVVPPGEDSVFGNASATLFLSAPSDFGPTQTRRAGLLALDPATGAVSDWYPGFDNPFTPQGFALDYLPATEPGTRPSRPASLWWGGRFSGQVEDQTRRNALAVDPATGGLLPFAPQIGGGDGYHAFVHALLAIPEGTEQGPDHIGGVTYAVGSLQVLTTPQPRQFGMAVFDARTGEHLAWDPQLPGAARVLLYSERHGALFVGGRFPGALRGSGHSGVVALTPYGVGPPVTTEPERERPRTARLSAPYPNPARATVSFTLGLPEAGPVEVAVFDVLGRRVAVVVEGVLEAGEHTVSVDVSGWSSGVYVVRAAGGTSGFAESRRVTVVR